MWPFATRGSRIDTPAPNLQTSLDFAQLAKCDASIKVWLPQVILDRINWVCHQTDSARADGLRALLFEHLYGRAMYLQLLAYKRAQDSKAKGAYSAGSAHRMMGIENDMTLTLPARMKQDLIALSQSYRLTPSSYVRKMLMLQLMGEPMHTHWQQALGKINPDVALLERDT